jgi:hypothetical protein
MHVRGTFRVHELCGPMGLIGLDLAHIWNALVVCGLHIFFGEYAAY